MNFGRKFSVLVVLFLLSFTLIFSAGKVDLSGVMKINYNNDTKAPLYMKGDLAKPTKKQRDPAKVFLKKYESLFRAERLDEESKKIKTVRDLNGNKNVKYQQYYKGIPVRGGQFYLEYRNNSIVSFAGEIKPEINVDTTPSISEGSIRNIAINSVPRGENREVKKMELMIFRDKKGIYHLSFKNHIRGKNYYWVSYVDANSGETLLKYNNIKNVSKTAYYDGTVEINMDGSQYEDTTRNTWVENDSGTIYTEGADTTQNEKCVQLLWSTSMALDYFEQKLNRDSWDGQGGAVPVNYVSSETAYYYNGEITIGDATSTSDIGFVGDLDAVAHEFSHGFCENSANLEYSYESGALNEANSDIVGNSVERWVSGDTSDWQVGEDAMRNGYDFLRSMIDPSESYNSQPEYYSDRYTGSDDNGGVHINASLGNKFYQLLVDGGTWYSENNGDTTVQGIAEDDAISIWYDAMTTKFTSTTDYFEARDLTIASAEDLFGTGSTQVEQVKNAWAAVGIGSPAGSDDGGGGSDEEAYEPNDSMSEAYEVTSGNTYNGYIYDSNDIDYYKFVADSAGTIDLELSNLAADYDMYLYDSSGNQLDKAYTTNDPETINYDISSSGTYYIKVNGYNGAYDSSTMYALAVSFTGDSGGGGSTEDPYEPNDSMSEAYSVSSGNTYNAYIYDSNDVDYYEFVADSAGTIDLELSNLAADYDMYLYDSSGNQLDKAYTTNDPETINYDISSSGTYYIKVNGYNGAYDSSTMYALAVSFTGDSGGGDSGEAQWYISELSTPVETPHPYENSQEYSYTYEKSGAMKVAIHFSRFEFESGYDYVKTYNSSGTEVNSYTGTKDAFWTEVEGDYIEIKAFCDYIVNDYGYIIDKVAYYNDSNLGFTPNDTEETLDSIAGTITPKVRFEKMKNYPNPFNPETNIAYPVKESGHVKVVIYDTKGKKIRTLVNEHKEAQEALYQVHWNGKDDRGKTVSSGVYYCVVKGEGFKEITKMVMLK